MQLLVLFVFATLLQAKAGAELKSEAGPLLKSETGPLLKSGARFQLRAEPDDEYSKYRVDFSLYFDALDPTITRFFREQLFPLWKDPPAISVGYFLYPYGNTKAVQKNGKWEFTCPRGPSECYMNKILSCIFYGNTMSKFNREILACAYKSGSPPNAMSACGHKVNQVAETEETLKCANTDRGVSTLLRYKQYREDDLPKEGELSLPITAFGKKYDPLLDQLEVLSDLRTAICNQVLPEVPRGCGSQTTASTPPSPTPEVTTKCPDINGSTKSLIEIFCSLMETCPK